MRCLSRRFWTEQPCRVGAPFLLYTRASTPFPFTFLNPSTMTTCCFFWHFTVCVCVSKRERAEMLLLEKECFIYHLPSGILIFRCLRALELLEHEYCYLKNKLHELFQVYTTNFFVYFSFLHYFFNLFFHHISFIKYENLMIWWLFDDTDRTAKSFGRWS